MTEQELFTTPMARLLTLAPGLADFVHELGLLPEQQPQAVGYWIAGLDEEVLADQGLSRVQLLTHLHQMWQEVERMRQGAETAITSLSLLPGVDKAGEPEAAGLRVQAGEIISVVGPTGAGKSCLLADIESLAQGDSPSRRCLLLNDRPVAEAQRLALQHKLVAQLSQNMNFVVDLTVEEFVTLHARCRLVEPLLPTVARVIACANDLTGEKFTADTPVTRLSGGQSRALMIADTALLGAAPIVLIDEIENAGVDRERALALLVSKEKIVFISTHDPLLALRAHRRLVIRHGGIAAVYSTSPRERDNLVHLQQLEQLLLQVREDLRQGRRIEQLAPLAVS